MTPGEAGATSVTLVRGAGAAAREAYIAAALRPGAAAILEGLAEANSALAELTGEAAAGVLRIAPGCLCCSGNLVLRVTLNRLLRRPPAHLYISVANAAHSEQLRLWLAAPPYDTLLALQADVDVAALPAARQD
ncbi:GTPase [Janthinobacterium sp.]|uniref:GTPase n=1 Tax=Janthinobacterium sp. TaxID=1871054 RepID=UPI00293D8B69|nr:GTPase [Janthinobacterium sp.]